MKRRQKLEKEENSVEEKEEETEEDLLFQEDETDLFLLKEQQEKSPLKKNSQQQEHLSQQSQTNSPDFISSSPEYNQELIKSRKITSPLKRLNNYNTTTDVVNSYNNINIDITNNNNNNTITTEYSYNNNFSDCSMQLFSDSSDDSIFNEEKMEDIDNIKERLYINNDHLFHTQAWIQN